MGPVRLYTRYIGVSIRSQMQYPASFIMGAAGQVMVTGTEFLAVWALLARFGAIRGWRLEEIALFYGIIHTAFALAEGLARGFDTFSGLVRTGRFDQILLRPRSAAFQVVCREWLLERIGRLAVSVPILVWAASALDVRWTAARLALLALTLIGGMCLFVGLFVLQATLSFWTIETLEVANIVTDGGRETGQYPLSVYRSWFRRFFTFVVPLAAVSYYPALAILGRPDAATHAPLWFQYAAPLIGAAFLPASLVVWRYGVRHYCSTGS
ncbi:MAG: ABC transporter permease [Planctomycetes bacterium]|nr:ABC transporter permease [Planctomycetota bacterium]